MGVQRAASCGAAPDVLMVCMWGNTTRKVDRDMMNKGARRSLARLTRITAVWGGITAGMIMLFGTTADASPVQSGDDRPAIVRVTTAPDPDALMRAAVRRCAVVPKNTRQACWSLYLRPAFDGLPSGRAVVAECIHNARVEAADYPGKGVFGTYVRGCVRGNLRTP